jgi:hypothetical protein
MITITCAPLFHPPNIPWLHGGKGYELNFNVGVLFFEHYEKLQL